MLLLQAGQADHYQCCCMYLLIIEQKKNSIKNMTLFCMLEILKDLLLVFIPDYYTHWSGNPGRASRSDMV